MHILFGFTCSNFYFRCSVFTDNLSSLLTLMKFKDKVAESESLFVESDLVSASIVQVIESETKSDIMKEVEQADVSHNSSISNNSEFKRVVSSDAQCCYCDKKFSTDKVC